MSKYNALRLENQLCFPLYAAAREVIKQYHPYLSELDLTYTQYICLMVLWEHGSLSVKELGSMLFLDSGTLTPVLKSLEAKGYIKRCRSESDERVVIAQITDEGQKLQERAIEIPQKMSSCVKLGSDEAMQLYTLLYKLLGSFKDNK